MKLIWWFTLSLYCTTCSPPWAFANDERTRTATAGEFEATRLPPGFQPIRGAEEKTMIDPNPLVVGAYAAFFAIMFIYVIVLGIQQKRAIEEIAELREKIKNNSKART